MAEKSGSRTHQGRLTPLTGFEDRASHRAAILFRNQQLAGNSLWGRRGSVNRQPGGATAQRCQTKTAPLSGGPDKGVARATSVS